jgi:hypothetical protein
LTPWLAGAGFCALPITVALPSGQSSPRPITQGELPRDAELWPSPTPRQNGDTPASYRRPPVTTYEADLDPNGKLPVVAWAALTTALLLGCVGTIPGALEEWQNEVEGGVTLLLAGPALLFGFVVRDGRGTIARLLTRPLRWAAVLLSGLLLIAGTTLVGRFEYIAWYWRGASLISFGVFALFYIGSQCLRKRRSTRKVE